MLQKTPGGGEMKVFDLVSETKTAQADGSSTVVALNNCGFFVMDDRTKDKVVNSRKCVQVQPDWVFIYLERDFVFLTFMVVFVQLPIQQR
jgi:hypothetical protein